MKGILIAAAIVIYCVVVLVIYCCLAMAGIADDKAKRDMED